MFHESLKRMLAGATLRGTVSPASPRDARTRTFRCVIERVQNEPEMHEWFLEGALTFDDVAEQVACHATVRWVGSVPVISLHDVDLPVIGTVERTEIILHNGLFAGMWVCAGVRGHVHGVVEPEDKVDAPTKCYVIERTGEVLRDWWTGEQWTEDAEQAQWYEHEPDAPRETADEGAYAVYYPHGVVEAI